MCHSDSFQEVTITAVNCHLLSFSACKTWRRIVWWVLGKVYPQKSSLNNGKHPQSFTGGIQSRCAPPIDLPSSSQIDSSLVIAQAVSCILCIPGNLWALGLHLPRFYHLLAKGAGNRCKYRSVYANVSRVTETLFKRYQACFCLAITLTAVWPQLQEGQSSFGEVTCLVGWLCRYKTQ